MIIKGCKTIAEYAIRSWIAERFYTGNHLELTMNGNEGLLLDGNGDTLTLVYDRDSKFVYIKE